MELVIYLILTWFIGTYFFFQKKRLLFIENLMLFLFFLFINKCVLTLISMNLSLIMYSKEPHLFLSFWLQRNIIFPLILLIFVNGVFTKSKGVKLIGGLFTTIVILLSEALAIHFSIINYHVWSFFISFVVAACYLLLALGVSAIYRRLLVKEGMVNT
ncbi:hypothetical protein FZC74_06155 [Sutcliffiella horikoshii]|uniref:Uncharacterized protein n=1 Tax=Sutcliffiella horikoshii TaxID=79883 RepID=A0AA95B795_9BACI|nr:hypothetical protein [Sutcliffiella horikoshii]TYS59734.1 hypothetical protein FZC74_06155 [Sutcliffiella horikoshii]